MTGLPDVLTHTFHPDYEPFGNLCDLPEAEAVDVFLRRRPDRPAYAARRFATERWLVAASRERVSGVRLTRPRYLFVGDFADGQDPARPASIIIPLGRLDPETLTFTYPDSMTSFLRATLPEFARHREPHHGRVFTLAGITDLVRRIGLPPRRAPRAPGAASDGFIKAQLWDLAPLGPWLRVAPSDRVASSARA